MYHFQNQMHRIFFCFRSVVEPCDTSGCQIHLKWEILIKIQQNLQSNINITKCWMEIPPQQINSTFATGSDLLYTLNAGLSNNTKYVRQYC